ncbi:MAG: alpha-2-macroglobulin family protein, partial [Dehalococcoidia bacterium]
DTPVTLVKAGDLVRIRLTIVAPSDLQQLRVEDLLPAGLEAVDGSLKTTDPNLLRIQRDQQQRLLLQPPPPGQTPALKLTTDRERRLVNPFDHTEVRDDRAALFASSISRGVHEYVYFARATTAGTFTAPPVTAAESAYPDVFGRSDSTSFTITP